MTSRAQGISEFESNPEFVETPKASTPAFEKVEDCGRDNILITPIPSTEFPSLLPRLLVFAAITKKQ
jgi:hypothetical protein